MRKGFKQFILILALIASIKSYGQQSIHGLKSYWDKGLVVESEDEAFRLRFGGRIQYDEAFFFQNSESENNNGVAQNGSEIRRVRFVNEGFIYNFINYKLEFDFSTGSPVPTDVYVTLTNLPAIGNVRVGHQKEPFSLDMMASSNDMTFMERAPATVFKKQRNSGILIFNTVFQERGTWAVGAYHNSDITGKSLNDNRYNVTGRITGLPYFDKDNKKLLHLGFGWSNRNPSNRLYNARSGADSNLSPILIDTDTITNVRNNYTLGAEISLVANSFSIQGEYIKSRLKNPTNSYNFAGYYGEVSYFITGESKNYSTEDAWFKNIIPKKNFTPIGTNKGWGAMEIAARYSNLNLNDQNVNGGQLNQITAAINWYLNPATKIALNYVHATGNTLGNTNIVQFRFQVAF